ncbi:MAG TPA: carboxymuconolactone decarboxylase family protein [Luteimonas sp.]|nr:carboxymuconolactone decarboxylase family protein [Luteimonas sp.]
MKASSASRADMEAIVTLVDTDDLAACAPGAVDALRRLDGCAEASGLEPLLLALARVRASQLNGSALCIDMHARGARALGEQERRLYLLEVWRETELYTTRERAALAWTEAVTRPRGAHMPDEVEALARLEFTELELVHLTAAIVAVNGWNRFAFALGFEPACDRAPAPARAEAALRAGAGATADRRAGRPSRACTTRDDRRAALEDAADGRGA